MNFQTEYAAHKTTKHGATVAKNKHRIVFPLQFCFVSVSLETFILQQKKTVVFVATAFSFFCECFLP